ncbi:coiled-coil domain-containing protein 125 isoform X2 [Pseudoliparis swirei]|uniref:coiled-coil domain-containing protein 125 isoform X2 n=1 Tax=Pseudoliparis swirei TaxID=2059687 RepID=UPI0024BD74BA|nr:coiled-coil domain-containing protein 125 isoform X2 [Pseudoliparis swirei]
MLREEASVARCIFKKHIEFILKVATGSSLVFPVFSLTAAGGVQTSTGGVPGAPCLAPVQPARGLTSSVKPGGKLTNFRLIVAADSREEYNVSEPKFQWTEPTGLGLGPMQEAGEACSRDDDMADGDLGVGMSVRAAPSSPRNKSQSCAGLLEQLSRTKPVGPAARIPGLNQQQGARWTPPSYSSLGDLSKDELKDRLQEATEVIDVLCCELEVAHRYVEGKYEALKILQGKAILDQATSHTKSLLQKTEAEATALEKEVNRLQWELCFNQVQMKKSQQSWEEKHSRMLSENQTLTTSLEERESEIKQLRAQNFACSRQCSELLSMLSVKERRAYQGATPQHGREGSALQLAVLGACRCLGVAAACPCSRTAAAGRKQLVQLQQELDAQRSRREEASMVADAFRIAFEQQLSKRSEHFLLLADGNAPRANHSKAEGANRSPLLGVSRRLRGLLSSKMPDDLLETLSRLLDLLNDKDEALAHQRKVSIMLAHSAEELQRRLSSHHRPLDPAEDRRRSRQTPDAPESEARPQVVPPEADGHARRRPEPPEPGRPPSPSGSRTKAREPSDTSHKSHAAEIHHSGHPES